MQGRTHEPGGAVPMAAVAAVPLLNVVGALAICESAVEP